MKRCYIGLTVCFALLCPVLAMAQAILDRVMAVECRHQPLLRVLELISNKGGFYFSYNSSIINKDSLVTLPAQTRTVRQTLDLLFHGRLEYREDGRYIILRTATRTSTAPPPDTRRYTISGIIIDGSTGTSVPQASIYDPDRLVATLSKGDGSFSVRIKDDDKTLALQVSKDLYQDTTILLPPGGNRRLTILLSPVIFTRRMVTISPDDYYSPDTVHIALQPDSNTIRAVVNKDLVQVERTHLAKFLLPYKLRIQTLNVKRFFTQRPVQLSLLPALSTNGRLNSQVTNKFSVNLIGGYSAGLRGIELSGAFNIDRKNVKGFQAAGGVNVVGGAMQGMQIAGLQNMVLDSVKGLQAAGFSNITKKELAGWQLSGAYNSAASVNGVQVSGGINYTRHLKGVQLGLINIADTSEGVSIGLINIVRTGYHELSLFADEVSPLNIAFRSGNAHLYTILLAGLTPSGERSSYHYGFGLGHSFRLSQRLGINTELSTQHLAPLSWSNFKYNTYLTRLNIDAHWRLSRYFSLSAGPSLAVYSPDQDFYSHGRLFSPLSSGYPTFTFSGRTIGWIGWRCAIDFL